MPKETFRARFGLASLALYLLQLENGAKENYVNLNNPVFYDYLKRAYPDSFILMVMDELYILF